ncbi:MAG: hypothetical protein JWN40_888 [Phycisphaerales bacterium]|nr:hypothetical protein [Phycisphaerales bacterium]
MRHSCGVLLLAVLTVAARGAGLSGFTPSPDFAEQVKWLTLDGGVRLHVNAPATLDPNKPTLLIVYATPNGNTIEQTLGCAKADGVDWHFDIQHVAAQVRRLREIDARENIVLAVTQAPKLSWPAFRQANAEAAGKIIQSVVEAATTDLPGSAPAVVLSGHSGGGSFIFGYINASETIPDLVRRIIFLDANYAYDDTAKHGEKLLAWLKTDAARRLVVIAYDDREIMLDGKKVVGPTGGTFRATGRMMEFLKKDGDVGETHEAPFTHYSAREGQIQFFIHGNPENKILHTTLVGEMNGLLHALTLGTAEEAKWGTFGGPRAYEKWVAAKPSAPPATTPSAIAPRLKIPERPKDAVGGAQFSRDIATLLPADREEAIRKQFQRGNVPDFLRKFVPIEVDATSKDGTRHTARYLVTPDYLAIGSDEDFFRVPMTPMTARALANALDCSMITRKISDDVYRQAAIKLAPQPLTEDRESVQTFYRHHQLIEAQRLEAHKSLGALTAGIKKDVVVTNRLFEKPERVAIYGWHKTDGIAIQPLTIVHRQTYVDYSHGVRLISRDVIVDGVAMDIAVALKSADLCALLSDEGPIDLSRFAGPAH